MPLIANDIPGNTLLVLVQYSHSVLKTTSKYNMGPSRCLSASQGPGPLHLTWRHGAFGAFVTCNMKIGINCDMRRHIIDRATRQYPVADFEGACECAPPPVWPTFYFFHTPVKIGELAISNSILVSTPPPFSKVGSAIDI